jgi:peptide deformylase
MALLKVIFLADPRLREPTKEIKVFDDKIKTLIADMYETMYHEDGIGLAAPQVGLPLKIAVIDVSKQRNQKFCIINPQIIATEGSHLLEEGCLSIPGVFDKAPRPVKMTVKAQNENGEFFEITGEELMAHCLQHEIDHLNGKLFIDYLSPLKQQRARKKLTKNLRHNK